MKIEKMTATFGKLKNATLEPGPGLTIIEAPNEAGKTTWCAFIRAMLYGVDTAERDRVGSLSVKTRAKPWDGAPMAGTMELEAKGRRLTVQRSSLGTLPFRKLTAIYTGTADRVPELTADNLGETLTGVGEEVFARTAYIRRPAMKVDQTADLEKRIASLVQTGDETNAFSTVEEELKTWQRKLRYNRTGELPRLEAELREAEEAAGKLGSTAEELNKLAAQVTRLQGQIAALEQDLETHDKLEKRSQARRLWDERAKLREAQARVDKLTAAVTRNGHRMTREDIRHIRQSAASVQPLRRVRDEAEKTLFAAEKELGDIGVRKANSPLNGLTEEKTMEISRRGRELAAEAEGKKKKPLPTWIPGLVIGLGVLILLLTSGVLAPFGTMIPGLTLEFRLWPLIGGAALLVAGVVLLFWKPRPSHAAEELQELLDKYGVSSVERLSALCGGYLTLLRTEAPAAAARDAAYQGYQAAAENAKAAEAEAVAAISAMMAEVKSAGEVFSALANVEEDLEALAKAEADRQAAQSVLETLESAYGDLPEPSENYIPRPLRDRKDTEAMLKRTREQLELSRSKYDHLSGARRTLGDPVVLTGRVRELKERLRAGEEQYAALSLALAALREANAELTTRFSPLISRKAGEYLTRLTDGRYERLAFDRGFAAQVRPEGDLLDRSVLTLSDGAADQVWFSLRLAMCELMLTGPEPCPLILDDALLNFDDQRCREAVDLLLALSEERQILLFTCHHREAEMAGDQAKIITL